MYSQQFAKSYKHGYYGFNAMVKIRNWLDFHQQQSKLCYRHVILVSQSPVRRPAQELTSVVNLPSPFSLYALVLTFTQYVILIRRQLFFRGMCRNICREDFGCHNLEMGATGIQWGRPRMLLTLYNDRKASHKKKNCWPQSPEAEKSWLWALSTHRPFRTVFPPGNPLPQIPLPHWNFPGPLACQDLLFL